MWKCICGEIHRKLTRNCSQCGRPFYKVISFAEQISRIDLALSLLTKSKEDIMQCEKTVLTCLEKNMAFSDIADYLERCYIPGTHQLAGIIRNLDPDKHQHP